MTQPAYFVIDINKINDPEGIRPSQEKVAASYEPFGGKRIVAGGKTELLEGKAPDGIIIILQFPGMEQARAWHESAAYQAIIGYRQASAQSNIYLVEGIALAS